MRARLSALAGIPLCLLLAGRGAADDPPAAPEPAPAEREAPAPSGAIPVVDGLHESLLECMKQAETLGYQGRYDHLAPALERHFDLGFMAEKSVGRYWRQASPEDQAALVDTFTRYTIATYAGRFTGWSGQHFETLGEEPSARGTQLVRTVLRDPEGDDVMLDYRLRKGDDGKWRIIDVYMNGTVSELALRRSEYSSLIKREGFQALLAALDERIEKMAEAPASGEG